MKILGDPLGLVLGGVGGFVANEITGDRVLAYFAAAITYLVVVIALFAALLKLWVQLIKSYIYVLINTVLAPFYIASGLIPGRSGIGNWLKTMLANLSVFPTTIIMFLLGQVFIEGFKKPLPGFTPIAPPLVGDFLNADHFGSIIGLGIILMTPEVVNIVRDALKAPEFKYASGIGRSLSAAPGITGQFGRAYSLGLGYTYDATGKPQRIGTFRGIFRSLLGG